MDGIYQGALWINLAVWTVIGFLCWIPLLARSTAALAGAILVSTITRSDPRHLREKYENAVSFYARGFETIHRVLDRRDVKNRRVGDDVVPQPTYKWDQIMIELLWTIFFWGTLVFSLYGFANWVSA